MCEYIFGSQNANHRPSLKYNHGCLPVTFSLFLTRLNISPNENDTHASAAVAAAVALLL